MSWESAPVNAPRAKLWAIVDPPGSAALSICKDQAAARSALVDTVRPRASRTRDRVRQGSTMNTGVSVRRRTHRQHRSKYKAGHMAVCNARSGRDGADKRGDAEPPGARALESRNRGRHLTGTRSGGSWRSARLPWSDRRDSGCGRTSSSASSCLRADGDASRSPGGPRNRLHHRRRRSRRCSPGPWDPCPDRNPL